MSEELSEERIQWVIEMIAKHIQTQEALVVALDTIANVLSGLSEEYLRK